MPMLPSGSDATIRLATSADVPAIEAVVHAAYTGYTERIGVPPGPMLDDYSRCVDERTVWVLTVDRHILGLAVVSPKEDHLYLDNIAIHPASQGQGLGRTLMRFVEAEARRLGVAELRLFTHRTMHENIALYGRTGWIETGRHEQDGYERVFFRKSVPVTP